MRKVQEFRGLDEILHVHGVHPTQEGLLGKKACAEAAGYKDVKHFLRIIKTNPSCSFIYAIVGSCGPDIPIFTLVHSVPPDCEFTVVSNQSSMTNWRQEHDLKVKVGQLERAGEAGKEALKKFTDVSGGTNYM